MFFLGTWVLEENKTFQCKDAKAYITTKTDSDFVIILSILLACCISEGFVRNATQWQAELCLWKINCFDWIFKRHFNMVPIAHHLRGLKRTRAQHFPFSRPRKYLQHCRKLFHCICKHSFQLEKKRILDLVHSHPSWKVLPWASTAPRAHMSSQIRIIILHADSEVFISLPASLLK